MRKYIFLSAEFTASVDGDHVGLHGEFQREVAGALQSWMSGLDAIRVLELDEFDTFDGVAVTHMVNAIRSILERQERLYICGAPQVLAHNLYRTGLLDGDRIVLQAMREDEAYG